VIYAAADLHGQLVDPPADASAILLVGDICPDFLRNVSSNPMGAVTSGSTEQADWLDHEFRGWLERLSLPTIAIWGNHDFVGEHPNLIPDLPWTLLQDTETEHDGLRIYGTPWVPGLPRWAFYASDEALELRGQAITSGIDILMSHGPPYRAGDYIPTSEKQRNKYGNFGGGHVGDKHLASAIRLAQPSITVCGHIHEAHGRHWLAGKRVYNVSALTELYEPRDDFWTKINP
jgi:Icc-related predicted phosphoesterase